MSMGQEHRLRHKGALSQVNELANSLSGFYQIGDVFLFFLALFMMVAGVSR